MNKKKINPKNIIQQIDFLEFRELSRALKTIFIEHLKQFFHGFDINLFDLKSYPKVLYTKTSSILKSYYNFKKK